MVFLVLWLLLVPVVIFTIISLKKGKKKKSIFGIVISVLLIIAYIASIVYTMQMVKKLRTFPMNSKEIEVTDLAYDDKGKATGYYDKDYKFHKFDYLIKPKSLPVTHVTRELLEKENLINKSSFYSQSNTGKIIIIQENHVVMTDFQSLFLPQTDFPAQVYIIDFDALNNKTPSK